MKHGIKATLSVILCAVMLFSSFAVISFAQTCTCTNDPIIYVFGKHELYCCDDNGNHIFDENGDYILNTANNFDYAELAKELLPLFAEAYFSHNWDEYSEKFLGYMLPLYEGRGCDGNGDVIDYVHYRPQYTDVNKLGWYNGTTHGYHMSWNSNFFYDYRESPILIAQKLDAFVQQVKEHTGHDKVVIVTRCQGANIVTAWLQLYESGEESEYVSKADMPAQPFESVSKLVFIDSSADGIDAVEEFFSGQLRTDTDALYRFLSLYDLKDLLGEELGELAATIIDMLKETYGINLLAGGIQDIYAEFAPEVLSPLLRAFYATCGGILACINNSFDEVIDFVYPTDELKEEYAGLIKKATYVNKNITVRTHEILKNAETAGVKTAVFAEYGTQVPPLGPDCVYPGDNMTPLADQSFGATCAKVTGTLSEKYIAAQTEKGLGRYISPDKQVDASTCLFPDTTWIIKNADHVFPDAIHSLALSFIREDYDVNTSAAYPQFLNYTPRDAYEGSLAPMQEKNPNDVEWGTLSGKEEGEATKTVIQKIIDFLKSLVNMIRNMITGIIQAAKS